MMLMPSVTELVKGQESVYSLVIATAKHARELAEKAEEEGVPLKEKPVTQSIRDICEGKVRIVHRGADAPDEPAA